MINDKKILILGLAKSGYYVAKLLAGKNEIIVTDQKNDEEKAKELASLGITFVQSETGVELLDGVDLLIKNPGIDPKHPCVQESLKKGIKIVNEMEVAYHYLKPGVKIIGVTGSNGKTTTTTMIYELLKRHNIPVTLGGNIGYPLAQIVNSIPENSVLLLEISDHQLYNLEHFKTDISVLTNLCPTHLDFHGTYENYLNTKKKIFNHHTSRDIAIINKTNSDSIKLTKDIKSTKVYFNDDKNYFDDDYIYIDGKKVLKIKDVKVKGKHNYENILASLLVLKNFAFKEDIIKEFLQTFNGVSHRLEIVNTNRKIDFYNDSKSTNPTSSLTALKTMDKKVHLILGGMERNQDFHCLDQEIAKVKCIYAIGEVADRVCAYAKEKNIPFYNATTLEKAFPILKDNVLDNEAVLLSPASASWDQYDKFETRGEEFKKLVEKYFN